MAGTIVVDRIESDSSYTSTINVASKVNFAGGMQVGGQDSTFGGMRNKYINGNMAIDQRNGGSSVTITTDGTYTLDRWKAYSSQASKYSVQQNAGSVTPPAGFKYYLGVTSLSSYSITSTDYFSIAQAIEGYNISDLAWGTSDAKSVTLSFWVRSSLTGTFGGCFVNGSANRWYPFSYTISSSNTWEKKTITVSGDTTGTWSSTHTTGLELRLGLGVGSTYSGSAGSWTASVINSVTGATSVVGTNGATFYITGVQLEKGSSATDFEYRPFGTEFAMCQRYYQKSFAPSTVPANNVDASRAIYAIGGRMRVADVTGFRSGQITFPCAMRATPTITMYNSESATGTAQLFLQDATVQNSTGAGPVNTSEIGFSVWQYTGVSIGNQGDLLQVFFHYTASSEL